MSAPVVDRLYTAAQSRAVDRAAIEDHGLPGPLLMARAARAAFQRLLAEVPEPESLQILCGPGNNGGDGLLVGVLAAGRGIPVRVFLVGGEPKSDDAQAAASRARGAGLVLEKFTPGVLEARGVVVDGMLGTGITGAPRDAYAAAIAEVNALGRPVLALDVPSGVNADTGCAAGEAIAATWTVSFITAKRGLYTGAGPERAGALSVEELEVPAEAFTVAGATCELLSPDTVPVFLPRRGSASHKGDYGRCLLIGGDEGMGGALILAAEAALRCGVGLARAATRSNHCLPLLARRPECMVEAVEHRNDLEPLLPWPDAIAVGPGLGQAPWGEQLLHAALAAGRPLVVDADALNLLARRQAWPLPPNCIITPHPGEAARLLGASVAEVQADRFAAAQGLWELTGSVVVLKGPGTLVCGPGATAVCAAGNPGMASGGMGDVLTGVIAALLAQGLAPLQAARRGVLLHSLAADRAAERQGKSALLAGDVSAVLGEFLP
jgi:hydroxyethylthiazole kinase-like uncharacterized protein yjeF